MMVAREIQLPSMAAPREEETKATHACCEVCGKACTTRCSLCRSVYYCSVGCQKLDWKQHKKVCRCVPCGPSLPPVSTVTNEREALRAMEELWSIASHETTTSSPKTKSSRKKAKENQPTPKTRTTTAPRVFVEETESLPFVVEEMPQIGRFQLTLRKSPERFAVQDRRIVISSDPLGPSRSLVTIGTLNQTLFVGEFPRKIQASEVTWSPVEDHCLVFRLPYPCDPSACITNPSTVSSLESIQSLVCGTCLEPLLPNHKVSRVFPLPQGHWEEIGDYLICHDGQPFVDLASGSECANPSTVLEDAGLLCFHKEAVNQSVCALAVESYGEAVEEETATPPFSLPQETTNDEKVLPSSAVIRGDRIWKDASDGGDSVSLCCGRCCSPLGFASLASPQTWRFWKHRLSTPSRKPLGSSSSFLARELVRYAESKAIFTFVVLSEDSLDDRKCILLRLLSWETTMAKSHTQKHRLDFRKVAKIVFEETRDPTLRNASHAWFWGGVDLCCPPPVSLETSVEPTEDRVSTVRLQLPKDEYSSVLHELMEGKACFPKDVADATILLKMGQVSEGMGLSAVLL